jgi:hypothetical protein
LKKIFTSRHDVNALDHRVKRFHKYVLSFEALSTCHPCNL